MLTQNLRNTHIDGNETITEPNRTSAKVIRDIDSCTCMNQSRIIIKAKLYRNQLGTMTKIEIIHMSG